MDCEFPLGRDLGPLLVTLDFTALLQRARIECLSIGSKGEKIKNRVNELCVLFLRINGYFFTVVSKNNCIGT